MLNSIFREWNEMKRSPGIQICAQRVTFKGNMKITLITHGLHLRQSVPWGLQKPFMLKWTSVPSSRASPEALPQCILVLIATSWASHPSACLSETFPSYPRAPTRSPNQKLQQLKEVKVTFALTASLGFVRPPRRPWQRPDCLREH